MKTIKRLLSLLLVLSLVVAYVPLRAVQVEAADNTTEFAGGSGTAEDPYLIPTKEHLNNVRNYLSAHFKMINDIEFTDADFAEGGTFHNDGAGWEPIGNSQSAFVGVFDGGNHAIQGLKIIGRSADVGLFGRSSSHIKNIHLKNAYITGGDYLGGICGYVASTWKSDIVIENCAVSDSIIVGGTHIGAICGYISGYSGKNVSIQNCHAERISVTGNEYVGGICGSVYYFGTKSFQNCYVDGEVTATGNYAAGICGHLADLSTGDEIDVTFKNCYNNASISSQK